MWNDVIISRDLPANVIKPRDLPVYMRSTTTRAITCRLYRHTHIKGLNKDDDVA